MSDTPTPAPSGEEFPPEQILIGRKAAWILTGLFLLLLAVPPLLDNLPGRLRELAAAVTGKGSSKPIAERLRGYDNSVASASFTDAPRRLTQQILTGLLNKGNDRVVIGKDGWLFYRPEIQALTGYGPITPEPHSVSRDPALLDWEAPLEPIKHFAAQLQERGVALWLVPVPMKPTIYPERLTGHPSPGPVRHREAEAFFEKLRTAGIHVHDPAAELWAAKAGDETEGPVYLKDDTHWTTRGMRVVAASLTSQLRAQSWWWPVTPSAGQASGTLQPSLPGHGDLVEKLGLAHPENWAPVRSEPIEVFSFQNDLKPVRDAASPLVLIGDSFVNIFDDPSLGFGLHADGSRSRAGLAWQLSALTGAKFDVHAVNGEGASGVRQWLAQRGESVVRSKKVVIWVIAERDLFLSRSVAKANRVSWDRVTIAPDPPANHAGPAVPAGPAVVEAELIEKSDQADPRRANYENSLYTVQYRILKNLSGPPVSGVVEVVHWSFKKRVLQPTSSIEPGKVYRLMLEPWAGKSELTPINREVLGEAAPGWFGATAEPVP